MNYELLVKNLLDRSLATVQNDPEQFEHWHLQQLPEWIGAILPTIDPDGCLAFFRDHKEYSFVYYDAFGKMCGKPREVASYLLMELIKELVEEKL